MPDSWKPYDKAALLERTESLRKFISGEAPLVQAAHVEVQDTTLTELKNAYAAAAAELKQKPDSRALRLDANLAYARYRDAYHALSPGLRLRRISIDRQLAQGPMARVQAIQQGLAKLA